MKEEITKILNDKLINSAVLGREVIFEHEIEDIVSKISLAIETKWLLPKYELPTENKKIIFKLKNNDIRMGIFLVKDQWDRPNRFCDGAFHEAENIEGWFYVPNCV